MKGISMKKSVIHMTVLILSTTIISFGIGKDNPGAKSKIQEKSKPGQASSYLEKGAHKGKVLQTMNSGGYTYIEFDEEGKRYWAAAPEFQVAVGEAIEFESALPMTNFTSKTLNRTFESIYFINVVRVGDSPLAQGKSMELPEGHAPIRKSKIKIEVEPGSVEKAENGFTIAECYARKDTLNGRAVKVRGRVVKFTANIMKRNWIHIQDGTGQEGTNDLTVTTTQQVQPGDLIVISGKLAGDKDFGAGYRYSVIIEEAIVTIENKKD
ncbi:DNA-binding protein [Acidobacteriota bacterium]